MSIDFNVLVGFTSTIVAVATFVLVLLIYIFRKNEIGEFYSRYSKMRVYYERQIYDLEQKLVKTSQNWTDAYHLYLSEAQKNESSGSVVSYIPDFSNHRFFSSLGITGDLKIDQNLAFVLTPFHEDFYEIFWNIQKSCHSVGLRCLRGDEEHIDGDLLPFIVKNIIQSRVVICVLDGRNPNVMYELGLAHAFDKYVILIASGLSEANSLADVKSNKVVIFSDFNDLKNQLYASLVRVYRRSEEAG